LWILLEPIEPQPLRGNNVRQQFQCRRWRMVKRGEGTNLLTISPEIVFELTLQVGLQVHSGFDFQKAQLDSETAR
jgi:hypothetical protein